MTVILQIITFLILSFLPNTLSDIYVYESGKLVEDYDDQPANFGPSFPITGIKGYVVLTNPVNACSKIEPPPSIPVQNYKWIALIARTKNNISCDFDLKVQNAQDANFSAVIIYNYEDSLITMGPHGRNVNISSTLITLTDGLSIISNYVYNHTAKNSTPKFLFKLTNEQVFRIGAYIIPFVCIIGVSFLGLICFLIVKCYIQRRRSRRHRLPRSALKQLKIKKFVKGDRWEVCAICLDDFEDGAKLRILPCDHAYHMKCIDPWLLNNRRQCPVCKRYVFPNHDNSDEEESSGAHTATERTPLIRPTNDDDDSVSENRFQNRRVTNQSDTGVSNYAYPPSESSENEDNDDESSQPRSATNRITTADLVFDQPRTNNQHHSSSQLPRIILRQSTVEENDGDESEDNNNTTATTVTTYGSVRDSTSVSFTTPRAANFFVGSIGGTTDNTNISAHSVIEDPDDDERMHSVLTDVELNPSYVPDDESTDVDHTNL